MFQLNRYATNAITKYDAISQKHRCNAQRQDSFKGIHMDTYSYHMGNLFHCQLEPLSTEVELFCIFYVILQSLED